MNPLEALSLTVGRQLLQRKESVSIAESCTGGLLGDALTRIPGSSAYFKGGIIAYHSQIKEKLLGVESLLLSEKGTVNERVAEEMAKGVRILFSTTWGISTTGVAGPEPGSHREKVGTVFVGVSSAKQNQVLPLNLHGSRQFIKRLAVYHALRFFSQLLEDETS